MSDGTHSIEVSNGEFGLSVSGSEEFVEDHFYRLCEEYGLDDIEFQNAGSTTGDGDIASVSSETPLKSQEQGSVAELDKTINEYLSNSTASSYQDNALVVGWYLEHEEGQDDFTPGEVEDRALSEKVELGTRVPRDLDKNVKKGFLHSPGKRDGEDTYWVTESGEEYLKDLGISP